MLEPISDAEAARRGAEFNHQGATILADDLLIAVGRLFVAGSTNPIASRLEFHVHALICELHDMKTGVPFDSGEDPEARWHRVYMERHPKIAPYLKANGAVVVGVDGAPIPEMNLPLSEGESDTHAGRDSSGE